MSILENVKSAIKQAMLARDKEALKTLRMLSAAFKQIEIDQNIELTDEVLQKELVKQVKQRKDSAKQFHEAGREDLALLEEAEIKVIENFLPKQLSNEEMEKEVDRIVSDLNVPLEMSSMKVLMEALKKELEAKADMAKVSQYLRQKIQSK